MVGQRLYSYIRHHRVPTNEKNRICFYHCIILTLLWHWVLIYIYCPEWRGFKCIVPFKAFTTIQCTQTKSTCKMKGPYSAPRLVMKDWRTKAMLQMLHVYTDCFGWISWKIKKKSMCFEALQSTFLDEYITATKPAATFKESISKWILCKYQIFLGVSIIFTQRV